MHIHKTVKLTLSSVCIASVLTIASLAAEYRTGVVTANGALNLRAAPSTSSEILSKLPTGADVTVIEAGSEWHKIAYSAGEGYVSAQYIDLADAVGVSGVITGSVVNMRAGASTDCEVLTKLSRGTGVSVTGREGEWYTIVYNERSGYLHSDYLTLSSEVVSADLAAEIIDYASKYLGVKYKSGGSSPSGFDCSGFTKYVFAHFNIELNRSSSAQVSNCTAINKDELQPGDLVFFANPRSSKSKVGHVGIYIGNNEFIHSSSPGDVVKIDSMSNSYYTKYYICSGRVL